MAELELGPLFGLYEDLYVGRLVKKDAADGVVTHGPFMDPEHAFKKCVTIRWAGASPSRAPASETVEDVPLDEARPWLQDRFAEDESLVPRKVLDLQAKNWADSQIAANLSTLTDKTLQDRDRRASSRAAPASRVAQRPASRLVPAPSSGRSQEAAPHSSALLAAAAGRGIKRPAAEPAEPAAKDTPSKEPHSAKEQGAPAAGRPSAGWGTGLVQRIINFASPQAWRAPKRRATEDKVVQDKGRPSGGSRLPETAERPLGKVQGRPDKSAQAGSAAGSKALAAGAAAKAAPAHQRQAMGSKGQGTRRPPYQAKKRGARRASDSQTSQETSEAHSSEEEEEEDASGSSEEEAEEGSGSESETESGSKSPQSPEQKSSSEDEEEEGGPDYSDKKAWRRGWTGVYYPVSMLQKPGDFPVGTPYDVEDDKEYPIEAILDEVKDSKGQVFALVKWKEWACDIGVSKTKVVKQEHGKGHWEPVKHFNGTAQKEYVQWKKNPPQWYRRQRSSLS